MSVRIRTMSMCRPSFRHRGRYQSPTKVIPSRANIASAVPAVSLKRWVVSRPWLRHGLQVPAVRVFVRIMSAKENGDVDRSECRLAKYGVAIGWERT